MSQGDNKTLLHCQAGCATNAVMEKLGLPMEALYDDYYDRDSGKTGPLAIYGYPDASGHVRYRVVRMPGHRFYQQRPDGKGGWVNKGVPPEQRVLYHLPEVLGAVQAGDPVFVTEGEKDADALVRDGYVATCNPGGGRQMAGAVLRRTVRGQDGGGGHRPRPDRLPATPARWPGACEAGWARSSWPNRSRAKTCPTTWWRVAPSTN